MWRWIILRPRLGTCTEGESEWGVVVVRGWPHIRKTVVITGQCLKEQFDLAMKLPVVLISILIIQVKTKYFFHIIPLTSETKSMNYYFNDLTLPFYHQLLNDLLNWYWVFGIHWFGPGVLNYLINNCHCLHLPKISLLVVFDLHFDYVFLIPSLVILVN